jgi:hypoxanthine-DNA glycosylase
VAKLKYLVDHKIALWDVIGECQRKGSLDSSIIMDTIMVNNFGSLFSEYPSIEHVFFNGKTAEKEYRKRVLPNLGSLSRDITYEVLPSTSPAHASLDKEQKLAKWSMVKSALNR